MPTRGAREGEGGVTYIVVAFRHDEERSVLYRKARTPEEVARLLETARRRGATFASVRFLTSPKNPTEVRDGDEHRGGPEDGE